MKIVYAINAKLGAGGLGTTSFQTVRAIHARGELQKAVCFGNRQNEIPRHSIKGINLHPVKLLSNFPASVYYPAKRRALDQATCKVLDQSTDLFHGWTGCCRSALQRCLALGITSLLEVPGPHRRSFNALLAQEHAELGIEIPEEKSWLERRLEQNEDYYAAEYASATRILLQSEYCRQTFIDQGLPQEKLMVVENGVDIDRYAVPDRRQNETFRVVFVGQLCLRKGVRYLLEAWSRLRLKNAELLLIGHLHEELGELVNGYLERCPDIRLTGQVNNVKELLQQASLFVLPSLVEGSAKVVYEAMASGLPVVVTPNSGSVAIDGEHGRIVPARSAEALAEVLQQLYERPEERLEMGLAARRRVETFTWEGRASGILECYEKLRR